MLKFILISAISVWLTSSLFMLVFWANAVITTYREPVKIFFMPLKDFLIIHFCPIVHTYKCFRIMRRISELKKN